MKRKRRKYRKARQSPLKKWWYGVAKIEGGPCFPVCHCCNGGFGPPHGSNKKLYHRQIRRTTKDIDWEE